MSRGKPIYDPVARRLLVAIREGRLECVAELADHLEETGEPRAHYLRIVLECYEARLWHYTPTDAWNWLRTETGSTFGRRWYGLDRDEAARLMGLPPDPG
jgi:hypothetical protein